MSRYSYERKFRLKILSLLLDNYWTAKFGDTVIKPEYFEADDEEELGKAILTYRQTYGSSPVDPDDLIALVGPEYTELVYYIYDLRESEDTRLAADVVIQFAKEQAAKVAILESVEDIRKGDLTTPILRMKAALKVGEDTLSPGIDPIKDIDFWLYDYWSDKVRTGMYHLDLVMDGGLGVPELGLIMAPPNRGKSMALINIGFGAAMIGSGKNVIHFSHEMSDKQVAKRYAARMTFKFPHREDDLDEYAEELVLAARKLLTGNIRIIAGKKSTLEIEQRIDALIEDGFEPGLIIDDYPDLIPPPRKYEERRFELSAVCEWARGVSEKYQLPFWGATQSGRASLSKEIISMQDIAEDIGKANIADAIIALCQTYDEEQADQCRLAIAKLRDGSKKQHLIACKFYGKSQAIITTGFVERKEDSTDA
jgi:replicative DNA helicase